MKKIFMKNQQGITKTLILIATFVLIVVLGNLAYFVYLKQSEPTQENIIEEKIEEVEEEKIEEEVVIEEKVPDFDYQDDVLLVSVGPCYLNDHPQDMIYFPEGVHRAFFDYISTDSKVEKLDCDTYDFEVVDDYVASLMQTDEDQDGLNLYLEKLYYTNDTKEDTDDDSYDDFTEIANGYNPNDAHSGPRGMELFDTEDEDFVDEDSEDIVIEEEDEDTDVVEEDDDGNSEDDNEEDVVEEEVSEITEPIDCLDLPDDDINTCLNDFVATMLTLEPCTLSDDFNRCVGDASIFDYINDSQECIQYQSLMTNTNFDICINRRALIDNNAELCLSLKESDPWTCVTNLVNSHQDTNFCIYNYFLNASINDIDDFPEHKACIELVYTDEAEIEQQAVNGCESIDHNASSSNELYKVLCFFNLAVAYNDGTYCDMAAMIDGALNEVTQNECLNKLNQ